MFDIPTPAGRARRELEAAETRNRGTAFPRRGRRAWRCGNGVRNAPLFFDKRMSIFGCSCAHVQNSLSERAVP